MNKITKNKTSIASRAVVSRVIFSRVMISRVMILRTIVSRATASRISSFYLVILLSPFLLQSCTTLAITSLATTTRLAMQERSIGEAVDDLGILLEIEHSFAQSEVGDLFNNVGVYVHEGRVFLTGNVKYPLTVVEAQKFSWLAKGVREVVNEIKVKKGQNLLHYLTDSALEAEISVSLLVSSDIKSVNYSIEVVNRVAYLFGISQNQKELKRVLRIVSTTNGIKKVVNHTRFKDNPLRHNL